MGAAYRYREEGFNIRRWELQNPTIPYHSIKATGNQRNEIEIPRDFIYGNYLYLRDVLFLYKLDHNRIMVNIVEYKGDRKTSHWTYILDKYESTKGVAFFIDIMFKPRYNYRYYFIITNLPEIPVKYNMFYKMHFRFITKQELTSVPDPVKNFFESIFII